MRTSVLLLCSVLIVGASAVAQTAPASPAGASQAASSSALPAPPPLHPLTVAQAQEILKLSHADKLKNQVMTQMMGNMKRVFPPYMPKDVIDDLLTSLENIDMDSFTVKIYQEHISEQDATAIIAFYKSPAGQRMLIAMPEIVSETQEAGARAGESVAREVIERHKAEIIAAAKKYKAMHSLSSQQ